MSRTPVPGGVLTLVGAGDVDHLDPALAYHTVTRGIIRAYTRQLVTYPASRDRRATAVIVPDLATEAAGPYDAERRRYRFTLREAHWADGRPVTANDVVRGIKRLCHPLAPSPGLAYYLSTIAGLAEFRDGLAALPRDLAAIARHLEETDVPGVRALDDRTVHLTTRHAMPDFLNILALPFATPAPLGYLAHAPGAPDLEQRIVSCGPYAVTRYVPGETIELRRNPYWSRAGDDVRPSYVDEIRVVEGLAEDECYDRVMSGSADLLWDIQPPTKRLPELFESGDPRLEVYPAGLLSPYLVVNFESPNERAAVRHLAVRRAVAYALDKASVAEVWGGPRLNDIAEQILPPLCTAHRPVSPYGTPGGTGDPERARRLLAEAGYPDGLTLKLLFRNRDIHPDTAEAVRAGLARAGIRAELVPAAINELFGRYFGSIAAARAGDWDIALTGWEPDWHGHNGRVYLQTLFDSAGVSANDDWGANFGYYRNERVNELLRQALTEADAERADEAFRAAEAEVLRDCAVVPILFAHQYWLRAERVRNWLPYPVLNGDLTQLWLDPEEES